MGEWREPSGTGTGTYKVAMARLEPDGVRAKRWRAGGVRVSQLVSQISVLARSEIIRDGAFHQGPVSWRNVNENRTGQTRDVTIFVTVGALDARSDLSGLQTAAP